MFNYINQIKMLTISCLLAIYMIGLQVSCVPVQNAAESTENFDLPENLNKFNNDEPKIEKRSSLNLYQSELARTSGTTGFGTYPNQKIAKNNQNKMEANLNEPDFINPEEMEDFLKVGHRNCKVGTQTREICEKCSKITRSNLAYAYCCINKESVRTFCIDFLTYSYTTSNLN